MSNFPRPVVWVLWRLLWATLLLCALCPTAHAAPKRVALLIGNGQYQFESTLPNPVRDVRLLAQSLRSLGFKAEVLENLPKREMDLAIKRFVRDSAGADTALLYYAGHGQQPSKGGRSFLLPVNANAVDDDQLEADGVPAEDIAAQLERLPNPARLRLVVLDACRNTRAVNRSTVRGLAPPARTDSFTLIAYSTDANAVAQDGAGQNSPYAQALAKHLPGLASKPVRQVFEDTAREVRQATRQQQWPRTYGDLESRIGLDGVELVSMAPAEMKPPVIDPEQTQWAAASRSNTVAAYTEYLRAYPAGAYVGAARNALAVLKPAEVRPLEVKPSAVVSPLPAPVVTPIAAAANSGATGLIDGRYQVLSDGSEVKDVQTGLVWARCSVGQTWDGRTCSNEPKSFNLDGASRLQTREWRLPTVPELISLLDCGIVMSDDNTYHSKGNDSNLNDCGAGGNARRIRNDIFPNTPPTWYWTSSPQAGFSLSAWDATLGYGHVDYGSRSGSYAARLVRASR